MNRHLRLFIKRNIKPCSYEEWVRQRLFHIYPRKLLEQVFSRPSLLYKRMSKYTGFQGTYIDIPVIDK